MAKKAAVVGPAAASEDSKQLELQSVDRKNSGGAKRLVEQATPNNNDRRILISGEEITYDKHRYLSNNVVTSSYTWYDFIFKNLFEQFSNVANVYFLVVGLLQMWKAVSTTNGTPTQYMPLVFIVFVSAVRSLKEDLAKHRNDAQRNGKKYSVVKNDGSHSLVASGDLKVGQVIRVDQDEMVPADIIFISSSLPKGHCFIDKSNLNGETTLEVFNSLAETRRFFTLDKDVNKLHDSCGVFTASLDYEPPNKDFDAFRGHLAINTPSGDVAFVNAGGKVLIMRETYLRNTEYIYGLIVYTGNDTKLQMSNNDGTKKKVKQSRVARMTNKMLGGMFLLQLVLCLINGVSAGFQQDNSMWYLIAADADAPEIPSNIMTGVYAYFSWFILMANMVPISLIVSLELIKFATSVIIQLDLRLYYPKINKRCRVNTMTIHEELGMVDYVFSDKTGTLTQNRMEFRYVLLPSGTEFGSQMTEIARSVEKREAELVGGSPLPQVPWTQLVAPLLAKPANGAAPCEPISCHKKLLNRPRHYVEDDTERGNAADMNEFTDEQAREVLVELWGGVSMGQGGLGGSKREEEKHGERKLLGRGEVEKERPYVAGPEVMSALGHLAKNEERLKSIEGSIPSRGGADNKVVPPAVAPSSTSHDPPSSSTQQQLRLYLRNMALSNTVKPYDDEGVLRFQSESSEEDAMVEWARKLGMIKRRINPTILETQPYRVQAAAGSSEPPASTAAKSPAAQSLSLLPLHDATERWLVRNGYSALQPVQVQLVLNPSTVASVPPKGTPEREEWDANFASELATVMGCGAETVAVGDFEKVAGTGASLLQAAGGERRVRYHVNLVLSCEKDKANEEQKEQQATASPISLAQKLSTELAKGVFRLPLCQAVLQDTNGSRIATFQVVEVFHHVATFGFNSQRARVSVVYHDLIQGNIMFLSKGQDSVMLPLLKPGVLSKQQSTKLLTDLNGMANKGLRTLLCACSIQPIQWWEDARSSRYRDLISRDAPPDPVGAKALKQEIDDFFAQVEKDVGLSYCGCMGLEDQLQTLVPETIRDCLHAGIKVWMITGDKLEAAKNIAMACNLIDPDMSPRYKDSNSHEEVLKAFNSTRLIEVTGQWASILNDEEEINRLFKALAHGRTSVSTHEIEFILSNLNIACSEQQLTEMLFEGDERIHEMDEQSFLQMMKAAEITPFEAVKLDIEQGLKRFNSISDHDAEPISVLVNKAAFEVMFPELTAGVAPNTKKGRVVAVEDPAAPSQEELKTLRTNFFLLAQVSKSVVFAQARPAMKKKMVTEIIARVPSAVTLAIGDGANDTDMICAAHVGVGIAGVEGTAASNSADYAVGTFRFLHELLLVHGFWSYFRISQTVYYVFYKASILAITNWLYGFYSQSSGTQMYNELVFQLYHIALTSLPILFVAVLDKPLPAKALMNTPLVYRESKGKFFTGTKFILWILRAFLHASICFFGTFFVLSSAHNFEGRPYGREEISGTVYFAVAFVPNFLILFQMHSFTILHLASLVMSFGAIFILSFILNIWMSINPSFYGVLNSMLVDYKVWMVWAGIVVAIMSIEACARAAKTHLRPQLWEIVSERVKLEKRLFPRHRTTKIYNVVDNEAESQWIARKPPGRRKTKVLQENTAAMQRALDGLNEENNWKNRQPGDGGNKQHKHNLYTSLVGSILRFRKLTGSSFESASSHATETFDHSPEAATRASLFDTLNRKLPGR